MKKLIICAFFCFLLTRVLLAQNPDGYNGLDSALLSIGFSASNLALAEATSAKAQNALSGFYNPAGLAYTTKTKISFLQTGLSGARDLFSIHCTTPILENMVLNLNWIQLQNTNIPKVTVTNPDLNTDIEPEAMITSVENGLVTALSYALRDDLAIGGSLSLYQQKFTNLSESGYGMSFSPGVYYAHSNNLSFGAYIKNLFSRQVWSTGTEEKLETSLRTGTQYRMDQLSIFYEIEKKASNAPLLFTYAFEYTVLDIIQLRVGCYPDTGHILWPIKQFNTGIGLNIGYVSIDYTYLGGTSWSYQDSSRLMIGISI